MKKNIIRTSHDGDLYFTLSVKDSHAKAEVEFTVNVQQADLSSEIDYMTGSAAFRLMSTLEIRPEKHFKACQCEDCREEE